MRSLFPFVVLLAMLSSCGGSRLATGGTVSGRDHVMEATQSSGRIPSGDNAVLTFTGWLYDVYGPTDIVVTAGGDTIETETTELESYILQLEPRPEMRIDFINDERVKTLVLVNFVETSIRETYDVEFRSKQSVAWIKKRPRDTKWIVIFYTGDNSIQF